MSFNPKVSIIIPVYNGSNYMCEAIDSALTQTYKNIEVLVINDGSNDGGKTRDIALSYGDRIRYFEKENGGVASALNLGIRKMKGDYFSWLSHDDVYYSDKIKYQISKIRFKKNVILYSDYDQIDENSKIINETIIPHFKSEMFLFEIAKNSFLHGCSLLIPKKAFNDFGFFNEEMLTIQDYDLWLKMTQGFTFVHLNKKLIKSRIHNKQGSKQINHLIELEKFYMKILDIIEPNNIFQLHQISASEYFNQLSEIYASKGFLKASKKAQVLSNNYKDVPIAFNNTKNKLYNFIFKILKNKNKDKYVNNRFKNRFIEIYHDNLFKGISSKSGTGSELDQTKILRDEIPKLVEQYNIKVFMDAPCGDFFWMKEVTLNVKKYYGIDIVDAIIKKNNEKYSNDYRIFICKNIIFDKLPYADLILCRDCLVHLTFNQAFDLINNFKKSGSKYLLTTTFTRTTPNYNSILDEMVGNWRPLNLQLYPFNFADPLLLINEGCTECDNQFTDKSLGLWELKKIRSLRHVKKDTQSN